MKRTVFLYGIILAVSIGLLKFLEYRYFVKDLPLEFYLGLVATFFAGLGIWVGVKLTRKEVIVVKPIENFVLNDSILAETGISKREHEVLELMAQGFSNQEIADKLFVSVNTIKTHASSLFLKLNVKRRTQAIQKGKELSLIP